MVHPPGPHQPGANQPGSGQRPNRARDVYGILALVCGILSIPTAPFLGGLFFGLPAIALAVLGFRAARRGVAGNRGVSLTGLLLGAISFTLAVFLGVTLLVTGPRLEECTRSAPVESGRQLSCLFR